MLKMGAQHLRVNLLINNCKQLARSILLLAHYTTEFAGFIARSVNCVVVLVRWTALSTQYTVSIFDSAYNYVRWWGRRGGRDALEIRPARNAG